MSNNNSVLKIEKIKDLLAVLLTNKCNLNCKHCMRRKDRKKILDFNIFSKVILKSKRFGVSHIALTGGEPGLHPKFENILKLIRENNQTPIIVTNGYTLRKYGQIIKQSRCIIALSMEGIKKENDYVRGPGSWEELEKSINFCRGNKLPFLIHFTVNKINKDNIDDTAEFLTQSGASKIDIGSCLPTYRNKYLVLNKNERIDAVNKIKSSFRKSYIPVQLSSSILNTNNFTYCSSLLLNNHVLDYNGSMCFCCDLADFDVQLIKNRQLLTISDMSKTSFEEYLIKKNKVISKVLEYQIKNFDKMKNVSCNCSKCFIFFGAKLNKK